jgi:hypothetical protein
MVSKEPQPRVEDVSLSGAMARQGGSLHHGQCTGVASTAQRRVTRSAIVCEPTKSRKWGIAYCQPLVQLATNRNLCTLRRNFMSTQIDQTIFQIGTVPAKPFSEDC